MTADPTDTLRQVRLAEVLRRTKPGQADYLRQRGWYRVGYSGWYAAGWTRNDRNIVEPPEHDRAHYTLAAAIRKAVSEEA